MQKLDQPLSDVVRYLIENKNSHLISTLLSVRDHSIKTLALYGAKLYLMDDGRWLIMDYLNIPDAPRHYIDCIEGGVCNMNVRIISESTKLEIEKNQEIFNDAFQQYPSEGYRAM